MALYCAQNGKCAITGLRLEIGNIECHHKLPRKNGGTDEYANLTLVCSEVHKLLHATSEETILKYKLLLKLTPPQLDKLNRLRKKLDLDLI